MILKSEDHMADKKRILVIDDEEDICIYSKSILEKTKRFQVLFATKAAEGINLAKTAQPNLIILDVFMPDMDGGDVANYLSNDKSTAHIPILFLTALATKADVEESAGNIAGRQFLAKPVTASELINRIDSILNK
jgi:CheY-like chemotaxis protein